LHMSPSAFFEHGFAVTNFLRIFSEFVLKISAGYVTTEIDIFLPDGGDLLRPDISFILEKNKHLIVGHIHGTPDLVCEVLSDSTKERDLGVKADRYLSNGVKEYWILNPADKSIQLWINHTSRTEGDLSLPRDEPQATTQGSNVGNGASAATWDKKTGVVLKSELLPGLQISTDDIFAGMPE
jgi:Uma2 family endonuclease